MVDGLQHGPDTLLDVGPLVGKEKPALHLPTTTGQIMENKCHANYSQQTGGLRGSSGRARSRIYGTKVRLEEGGARSRLRGEVAAISLLRHGTTAAAT